MIGCSGAPLAAKLCIKDGMEVSVVNAPGDYARLVAPLPPGARIRSGASAGSKLVHLFATRKVDLAEQLQALRKKLGVEVGGPQGTQMNLQPNDALRSHTPPSRRR